MRRTTIIGIVLLAALAGGAVVARNRSQAPTVRAVDEKVLREYTGVYRWGPDAFVYLQLWHEFTGFDKPGQLVSFDESGVIRVLYPTGDDRFFAGPGVATPSSVESRIDFQRDSTGRISSLTWASDGSAARTALRADVERREDVRFVNGEVQLAGTLIAPNSTGKHAAVILVHGSGAENREFVLPFARFLVRRGVAVLGYDKRGVNGSGGDWQTASFEVLAGDVIAAFDYLKTRNDIDASRIGLLGVSQAGWIMPLAAVRASDLAFLISVSGAGVPPAETTIDQAQNEMSASGMKPQTVAEVVALMKLQYRFARTGEGWDDYAAARGALAARMGQPPPAFPGTRDHPLWQSIRLTYFSDPAATLAKLRTPILAIFGELDNNILAKKNSAAWEAALKSGGHPDYTLRILPRANHYQWEAKAGNNAEMKSLQRFVPEYFTTIEQWLAKRGALDR
jgi:pimeloyl-ACP methyl ester carboxylesterase